MADDNELLVRAAIRDELTAPLAAIRAELKATGDEAGRAGGKANIGARGFDRMTSSLTSMAKVAGKAAVYGVAGVTAGIAAATGAITFFGVKSAIGLQTATANLKTLTGSAKTAAGMVKQLNAYGNATTFDTQGLTEAAQQMLTYGINARDVMPDIKMLGDISMGNQEKLSGLAYVFAQVQGNGHLMGQDLLQMINQGFNPLNEISKRTGKSMGVLREEMSKGQISFAMVKQAMVDATSKGGQFYKGASNGSKTVAGAWGNMTGTISSGLGLAFTPLLPVLQKLMGRISDLATGAMPKVDHAVKSAIKLGGQLGRAFQRNGLEGAAHTIKREFGVNAPKALRVVKGVLRDVGKVITGVLVPAFKDSQVGVGTFLTPLGLLRKVLGAAARHTTTAKVALEALVVALTAAKAASVIYTGVTKVKATWDAISTAKTKAKTAATKINTAVEKLAHSTLVTWIGVKALELGAWARSTAATVRDTAVKAANRVATVAANVATKAWAAGQWLLNAALSANPIGIVIAVIAGLVAAFVIAYKKSDTFRAIVDATWAAIKTAGKWIWDLAVKAGKFIAKWSPLGVAIRVVKDHFDDVKGAIDKVVDAFKTVIGWAEKAGGAIGGAIGKAGDLIGKIPGIGDTAASHAQGRGNIATTLATHAQVSAATGARPTITNAFVGGGGKGHGSGDHQAGRALDLQGPGLAKYGRYMRQIGGYAAFHGSGAGRHLHAVPPAMGDTSRSMARSVRPRAGAGAAVDVAPIVIQRLEIDARGASSDVDVEAAALRALRKFNRDRTERR